MERITDTMEFHENGAIAAAVLWRRISTMQARYGMIWTTVSLTRQIGGVQIGNHADRHSRTGTVRASVCNLHHREMQTRLLLAAKKVGGGGHVRACGSGFHRRMAASYAAR